jgi:hypothetical protein
MLAAKRLRMDLLQTKGDLERELGRFVRDCQRCERDVHGSRESVRNRSLDARGATAT